MENELIIAGQQMAEVTRIFADAPEVLTKNKTRAAKASEVADALINNAEEVGMSDPLDSEMAKFIERAKKTLPVMNDDRKPFSQLMDALKKEFTGAENAVKSKIEQVQGLRDGYATAKRQDEERRQKEIRDELAKKNEAIEIVKDAEYKLHDSLTEHIGMAKDAMLAKFNGANLDNFDDMLTEIAGFNNELSDADLKLFIPKIRGQYHDEEECEILVGRVFRLFVAGAIVRYHKEIEEYKIELQSHRFSRRAELKEIADADGEKRAKLEAEKAEREERKRKEAEAKSAEEKAKADAERKAEEQTAKLQAEIAAAAEIASVSSTDVKEGYEITVSNSMGYLQMANAWFAAEGKTMALDKIERMTFDRIRKWCEKKAIETGEMVESPFLEYIAIYKAK